MTENRNTDKSRKKIYYLLLVFPLFLYGCGETENLNPPPPKVIVTEAVIKEVNKYMDTVGQIVAKEKVNLRARITGFIEKQNFPNGAMVKKGDVIFLIQQSEYKADLEAAKANLQKANAELKNSIIDYNRKKFLVAKKAVSEVDYDQASTVKATAEANVLKAKSDLELAELNMSYTTVEAPYNGMIGIATYDPGNLVSIASDPLITLVMMDPILVEFNLSESLLMDALEETTYKKHRLRSSGKDASLPSVIAKLFLANGSKYQHSGKIVFINNVINPMTGTIRLRAIFKNNGLLIPGGYVKVRVQREKKMKALLIPQAAIQEDQQGPYIYIVDKNNKVSQRYIKTGSVYDTEIIVKEGLKEGEIVIIQGLQKVRPDITVNPVKIKPISNSDTDNIKPEKAKDKKQGTKKSTPTKDKGNNDKKNIPLKKEQNK